MVSITKTRAVASAHRPVVDVLDVPAGFGGDRAVVASYVGLPAAGRGRLAPMATADGTALSAADLFAADVAANTAVASGSPPRGAPV